MHKIRTLIAHNDEEVRNTIVNAIEKMKDVEIVGTTIEGKETYQKILELKPELIFTQYNFENMSGLELMKQSKEKLQDDLPIFNIIVDEIPHNELKEALNITDDKINALVRKPYYNRVVEIMEVYKNK